MSYRPVDQNDQRCLLTFPEWCTSVTCVHYTRRDSGIVWKLKLDNTDKNKFANKLENKTEQTLWTGPWSGVSTSTGVAEFPYFRSKNVHLCEALFRQTLAPHQKTSSISSVEAIQKGMPDGFNDSWKFGRRTCTKGFRAGCLRAKIIEHEDLLAFQKARAYRRRMEGTKY